MIWLLLIPVAGCVVCIAALFALPHHYDQNIAREYRLPERGDPDYIASIDP